MSNNDCFDPKEQEMIPGDDLNTEDIPTEAEPGAEESSGEDDAFYQDLSALLGEPLGAMHPAESETEMDMSTPEGDTPPEESAPLPAPEEFRDQEYRDTFGDDLEWAFGDTPEQPGEPEEEVRPARRKAPKKPKKGSGLLGIPHFVATLIYFAVILAISVTLARMLWLCADDMLALTKEDQEITVTIAETDTLEDIADKLVDAGLVRYKKVFLFYANLGSAREKISSGTFTLNSMYDYPALIRGMSTYASGRSVVTVTIPEGYNCRQMFSLLEEKGVCSVESLEEASMEGDFDDYWFLEGVERDSKYCLEGYLFPDTYDFYEGDNAERVIEKMLDDFDYRFRDTMRELIPTLNERLTEMMRSNGFDDAYIEAHQVTIREIVIVASMVEKETANNEESPVIASVIYNRLTNAGNFPYLNIDATILYALGEHKEELTLEDLQIDSPYNTYTHAGLTPGPISNPGLASLQAALNPEDTDYYYYALDESTGEHHFSRTQEEHNAFLGSQS